MKTEKSKTGYMYIDGEIRRIDIEMEKGDQLCISYHKLIAREDSIWPASKVEYCVVDKESVFPTQDECKRARLVIEVPEIEQTIRVHGMKLDDLHKDMEKIKNNYLIKLLCKL